MKINNTSLIVGLLVLLSHQFVWANAVVEDQKLFAQSTAAGDQFGRNIAITNQGNRMVAGSAFVGSNNGAAHVFEKINGVWTETQALVPSDNAADDFYGASVAIDGNVAVVAATGQNNLEGSVFIFRQIGQNWVEEAKITASDTPGGAQFGSSMKLDSNILVVGAQGCCSNAPGAAYVFEYDGTDWTELAKLTASNGQTGNLFGNSVDIKDGLVIVGAYRSFGNRGAAYVYQQQGNAWPELQGLVPLDASVGKLFASSVAIGENNQLLIGAFGDRTFQIRNGAVYVFDSTTQGNRGLAWSQVDKLFNDSPAANDLFGGQIQGIDVDGEFMVVASTENEDVATNGGAAHLFQYIDDEWTEVDRFTASDVGTNWRFGSSVVIENNTILVGANGANSDAGAVYSFTNDLIFENAFE